MVTLNFVIAHHLNNYFLFLLRDAHHNLFGCFQSAFESADFCNCATWQVEEASQYIHGYETDYSRHMNMHCQGETEKSRALFYSSRLKL